MIRMRQRVHATASATGAGRGSHGGLCVRSALGSSAFGARGQTSLSAGGASWTESSLLLRIIMMSLLLMMM